MKTNILPQLKCRNLILVTANPKLVNVFSKFVCFAIVSMCCSNIAIAQSMPTAVFNQNQTSGCAPLSVQFTNQSINANSYHWIFGNGNSSTIAAPSNVYSVPGIYTVLLVAQNNAGSDTSQVVITVLGKPTANFSVSATSGCENANSFTFTNQSSGGNTYLWDFGDGSISTLANPVHSYSMSGIFAVKLSVTNNSGCTDLKEKQQLIQIHAKPTAGFTVNKNYGCDSTSVFQFSSTAGLNTSANWSFGNGATANGNNPSFSYPTSGTFTVQQVATSSQGCRDTIIKAAYIKVSAYTKPTITTSTTNGCAPLAVNFTGSLANATSFNWSLGNNTNATGASATGTYSNPGNYTVSVTAIDTNQCAYTAILSAPIIVAAKPSAAFTYSQTASCNPNTLVFNNTSTGATNYKWNFGDGDSSFQQNPIHTYPGVNGSFFPVLTAYSSNGCSVTATLNHPGIMTTAGASFTSNGNTVGCSPMQIKFNPILGSSISNSLSQITWLFGDGSSSNQLSPTKTYNTTGTFTVKMIYVTNNGCRDTVTKINYVQVINPYQGYVTPDTIKACYPFTANLNDNTNGVIAWNWNFGDGTTSTLKNPQHTYATPGIYNVTLTSTTAGGCIQTIPSFQVFHIKGGIADFAVTSSLCPPYIATFSDSSINAVTWFWEFGDGTTSTLQNPAHTYPGYGLYDVTLTITTADGCSNTTQVTAATSFVALAASFTYQSLDTIFPMPVQFWANSVGATSWLWNFDDGTTSVQENPLHIFQLNGTYNVSLTISNGTCSQYYPTGTFAFGTGAGPVDTTGTPGPVIPPKSGCVPYTCRFVDPNSNSVSWFWTFGDGTSSTLKNPEHTYLTTGVFDVTLIAGKSGGGSDTLFMPGRVRVSGPLANFSIQQLNNCNGTNVSISDLSANASQWYWNFGDGNSSTVQNPVHTYTNTNANYGISLMAADSNGCHEMIYKNYFAGQSNPIAVNQNQYCQSDSVPFSTTLHNYNSYLWNFGDGTSSSQQNPNHLYTNGGNYNVTLTVGDSAGCLQTFSLASAVNILDGNSTFAINGPASGCNTLWTQFKPHNQNYNSCTYSWDFGDGTYSNVPQPYKTYSNPGIFSVRLTVNNGTCITTTIMPNAITVSKPTALFNYTQQDICTPSSAMFNDQSVGATSWLWNFGDGNTSILQNPNHVFNTVPSATITLYVTDSLGCVDSISKPKANVLKAAFAVNNNSGCTPLNVSFIDTSNFGTTWYWNFGDGTTSNLQNPAHTYNNAGNYSVMLIVTSAGGCKDTLVSPNLVSVSSPAAAFSKTMNGTCAPALVDFNDNSINAVSWMWDFGDNTFSAVQHPSKIYNTPGIYTIKLTVTNALGCTHTITKTDFIKVNGPGTAFTMSYAGQCAPVQVSFNDQSLQAVNWVWNFGDGTTSTLASPTHLYSDSGSYTVTLITQDTAGCSSAYTMASPLQVNPQAQAAFTVSGTTGCSPFAINVTNNSISATNYQWNFGDGGYANTNTPNHIYTQAGSFQIELIANNIFGCADTMLAPSQVLVKQSPVADFSTLNAMGCAPMAVSITNMSSYLMNPVFNWQISGGITSQNPNPTLLLATPGVYDVTLTVTNSNNCKDSIHKPNFIVVNDNNPPAVSKILAVSVNDNQTVSIRYSYVQDTDLQGYRLFRKNLATGNFDLISTYLNPNNTSFAWDTVVTDTGLNTQDNVYTYKVQSFDMCDNAWPLDSVNAHSTINVNATTTATGVKVNWTAYEGCNVANYEVWRKPMNSNNYQRIATLPADSLNYSDDEVRCPADFTYRIEATALCGNNFNSYSDTTIGAFPNLFGEQTVEIVRSTVVDNQTVLTEWKQPVIGIDQVLQYNLYRSANSQNFSLVASLPAAATDYMDYDTDVQKNRYIYYIEVINACHVSGEPSNLGNSILLKGNWENEGVNLNWNSYYGWTGGVEKYIVERLNIFGNWENVGEVNGQTLQYFDKK